MSRDGVIAGFKVSDDESVVKYIKLPYMLIVFSQWYRHPLGLENEIPLRKKCNFLLVLFSEYSYNSITRSNMPRNLTFLYLPRFSEGIQRLTIL